MYWIGLALTALATPESIWVEAESFGPLRGANYSFMREDRQTSGSWSVAGPDVAASWTQGGESEFMSIAARAGEIAGVTVTRDAIVPKTGQYELWVRYADYRGKDEEFAVRTRQGSEVREFHFGLKPVIDELDPMKVLWDWSYGWDSASCALEKGKVSLEIATTGPTGARRNVDCLCLTTDASYRPTGREKPSFASWAPLEDMRRTEAPDVEPLVSSKLDGPELKVDGPPHFLWNVGAPWDEELKKPDNQRIDSPFSVDPPLLQDFIAAFKATRPPVYGSVLSGPVWHITQYPTAFASGSPFIDWLERHPDRQFAILLNYGEPRWPEGADRKLVRANLEKFRGQFSGFIAGENIAYAATDEKGLEVSVRAAKSRSDVLTALKRFNTEATVEKFRDYFGAQIKADEAWADVVPCLSANNEALCHALCAWGVKCIGHENTGNSPTLARRLAFLRGATRQFGCQLMDYQSANLGDSATMFSREAFFYPASSRYILDNSYDAWAGAGTNWLLKDYLLWYLAGATAFYNEQGVDIFWKPAGGSAGDDNPVQLSPKGKVAEAVQKIFENHQRPTQFTPIAFLLDEAHGWSQERFQPGAFGLDPQWNPAVLTPGRHEASLRGWFDVAYYPAPETQNEPATAIRQTFVNGVFGDIFDVIVTARGKTGVLDSYPVVIAAGEVTLTKEWAEALRKYVVEGGTLVASIGQLSGPVPPLFNLTKTGDLSETSGYRWTGQSELTSAIYEYVRDLGAGRILASTATGSPLVVLRRVGKGQVIAIGVPLGIGLDDRPVPFLGSLLQRLVRGLTPIQVHGDVEWTLGKLADGGWLVGLFNNRGVTKPQHGVLPTDHSQVASVKLKSSWPVAKSSEWMTGNEVVWKGPECDLTIPAGAVRLVAVYPEGKRESYSN